MNRKLFHKIASDVEEEWQHSGLTDTIYEEYAWEILGRYLYEQSQAQPQDPADFEFMGFKVEIDPTLGPDEWYLKQVRR
jgi:hypothetical protein